MTTNNPRMNYTVMVVIAVLAIIALVWVLQNPNQANKGLRNATEDASYSLEKAGRGLDPDRSAGEKIGDAVKDVGHDIDKATRD